MNQGGDAHGDRSDSFQPQGIDSQAAQYGQDLNGVVLQIPVRVYPERHIATQCQLFSIDQRWMMALSIDLAPVRKLET